MTGQTKKMLIQRLMFLLLPVFVENMECNPQLNLITRNQGCFSRSAGNENLPSHNGDKIIDEKIKREKRTDDFHEITENVDNGNIYDIKANIETLKEQKEMNENVFGTNNDYKSKPNRLEIDLDGARGELLLNIKDSNSRIQNKTRDKYCKKEHDVVFITERLVDKYGQPNEKGVDGFIKTLRTIRDTEEIKRGDGKPYYNVHESRYERNGDAFLNLRGCFKRIHEKVRREVEEDEVTEIYGDTSTGDIWENTTIMETIKEDKDCYLREMSESEETTFFNEPMGLSTDEETTKYFDHEIYESGVEDDEEYFEQISDKSEPKNVSSVKKHEDVGKIYIDDKEPNMKRSLGKINRMDYLDYSDETKKYNIPLIYGENEREYPCKEGLEKLGNNENVHQEKAKLKEKPHEYSEINIAGAKGKEVKASIYEKNGDMYEKSTSENENNTKEAEIKQEIPTKNSNQKIEIQLTNGSDIELNAKFANDESNVGAQEYQPDEILQNFLTVNYQNMSKGRLHTESENLRQYSKNDNLNKEMPTYTDVVGEFGKIIIDDYCKRIKKSNVNKTYTFYTCSTPAKFCRLLKSLPIDKIQATGKLSYEWLLKVIYPESYPYINTSYLGISTPILLGSETTLNINDINVIWNVYNKVCTLKKFIKKFMLIYISENGKSEPKLQNNVDCDCYYSFYDTEVFQTQHELSCETYIQSKVENNEIFSRDKRMFYLHYSYLEDALNLELHTPVMGITLKSFKSANPKNSLILNAINKVSKDRYTFGFNFINYNLANIKFNKRTQILYHENVIGRIFRSLSSLNDYPTANLTYLAERNFYDELLFLNGTSCPWVQIKHCKHLGKIFSSKFDLILHKIKNLQNKTDGVELFIAHGEPIVDGKNNIQKISDSPSIENINFPITQVFNTQQSLKRPFILTVKKNECGKNNLLHVLFSPESGVFYGVDLPLLLPLFGGIVQDISRILKCSSC